jgi:hypothetical protein
MAVLKTRSGDDWISVAGVKGDTGPAGPTGPTGPVTTQIDSTAVTTNASFFPVFVAGAGTQTPSIRTTATAFSFNPSTSALTVGGTITAPTFSGNATTATSASYALTASVALNAVGGGFPFTGSAAISGSLLVIGPLTATSITETSTLKLKQDIAPLEPQSSRIQDLNPVRFTWKDTGREDIGLIAEEVAELYPEMVEYDKDGHPIGIHYSKLVVLLIRAFKELMTQQST